MNKRLLLLPVVIFILVSPLLARALGSAAIEVEVEPTATREIRETVLATGNLIYREEALLSPEIIARVKAVLVREGEAVRRGQVAILLEEEDLRQITAQQRAQLAVESANVQRQHSNVRNLQLQLDRVSRLIDRGFVSKASYDAALYALNGAQAELAASSMTVRRAEAALKQASYQLDRTVIRAPMSGTVVSVNIKPGETAVPSATGIRGSSLLTIANKDTMMVDLNVDENDVGRLSLGSESQIICPTLPGQGIIGHLREIALVPRRAAEALPMNDASGRAYSVKVDTRGAKVGQLRQGMSCRAKIFTDASAPVLTVPVQAVISDRATDEDGISLPQRREAPVKQYVFVVNGGRAERRLVKTGTADDEYQAILSGLNKGDKVVVGPYKVLRDLVSGAKVAPKIAD